MQPSVSARMSLQTVLLLIQNTSVFKTFQTLPLSRQKDAIQCLLEIQCLRNESMRLSEGVEPNRTVYAFKHLFTSTVWKAAAARVRAIGLSYFAQVLVCSRL